MVIYKLKNLKSEFSRIAVKVGSNVITKNDGSLNTGRMLRIVEEIAVLWKQGIEVILITSGAVAAGRSYMNPSKKTSIISARQIWAAIGQVKLMSNYQFLFGKYGIQALCLSCPNVLSVRSPLSSHTQRFKWLGGLKT